MKESLKAIKTWEDVCQLRNIDPVTSLPDLSSIPDELSHIRKYMIAHFKLVLIVETFCDGWVPDYSNRNQWKYYPWFKVDADKENPSGFGFSHSLFVYDHSDSTVGSRLCFPTRELALHVAKVFEALYIENQLIIK